MNTHARRTEIALIAVVVVGLGIDAFVHFHYASAFAHVKTSTISESTIFRIDASVAIVAALALILRPRRYSAAFAFLIAAAGTVAVTLYRYVNVGKIGPIPNMYDPYWQPFGKALSAIGEIAAALAAATLFVILHQQARSSSGSMSANAQPVRA
jgi:hypothetical protein